MKSTPFQAANVVLLLAVAGGLSVVLVSGWRCLRAKAATESAARGAEACADAAGKILALRAKPRKASFPAAGERTDMARLLEAATARVQLPATIIRSVTPDAPRRLKQGSAYLVQETRVDLAAVETPQLISYLYDLVQQDPSISVSEIDFSPSPGKPGSPEKWTSSVTFAQLFYAPGGAERDPNSAPGRE
jgi:hypothetical protein